MCPTLKLVEVLFLLKFLNLIPSFENLFGPKDHWQILIDTVIDLHVLNL